MYVDITSAEHHPLRLSNLQQQSYVPKPRWDCIATSFFKPTPILLWLCHPYITFTAWSASDSQPASLYQGPRRDGCLLYQRASSYHASVSGDDDTEAKSSMTDILSDSTQRLDEEENIFLDIKVNISSMRLLMFQKMRNENALCFGWLALRNYGMDGKGFSNAIFTW